MGRRLIPPHRSARGVLVMLAWGLPMAAAWLTVTLILTLLFLPLGLLAAIVGIIPMYHKMADLDTKYPRH